MLSDFFTALSLLTICPVPGTWFKPERPLGKSLAWFPVVGLLLGLALTSAGYLFRAWFPDLVTAALVVALWAALTGALHLEAVADCGDGLFSTVSRDKRQEIMHDPHVGAFGAVTLIVVLLLKFAAVASLRDVFFLTLAPLLARWAMVLATVFPLARTQGMAVLFRQGMGRLQILAATVLAALATVAFGWRGLLAFCGAVAVVLLLARLAQDRLGGMNGDVYGAIGEVTEVVVLMIGTLSL